MKNQMTKRLFSLLLAMILLIGTVADSNVFALNENDKNTGNSEKLAASPIEQVDSQKEKNLNWLKELTRKKLSEESNEKSEEKDIKQEVKEENPKLNITEHKEDNKIGFFDKFFGKPNDESDKKEDLVLENETKDESMVLTPENSTLVPLKKISDKEYQEIMKDKVVSGTSLEDNINMDAKLENKNENKDEKLENKEIKHSNSEDSLTNAHEKLDSLLNEEHNTGAELRRKQLEMNRSSVMSFDQGVSVTYGDRAANSPLTGNAPESTQPESNSMETPKEIKEYSVNVKWLKLVDASTFRYEEIPDSNIVSNWSTGSQSNRLRMNFKAVATESFKPGEIQIEIPKQILKDRDGKLVGSYNLSVPRSPSKVQPLAYKEEEDKIIILNEQEVPASYTSYVELDVNGVNPLTVYDKDAPVERNKLISEPFSAIFNLIKDYGNKSVTSNELTMQVDTDAYINEIRTNPDKNVADEYKRQATELYPNDGDFPSKEELKAIGIDVSGYNDTDKVYGYFDYSLDVYHTQPYISNFKTNRITSNYNGEIIAYKKSSDNILTKTNGDINLDFQYGENTSVRLYVVYNKNEFPNRGIYKLNIDGTYSITTQDNRETKSKSESTYLIFKPVFFERQYGRIWAGKSAYDEKNKLSLNRLVRGEDIDVTYNASLTAFGMPYTINGTDFENYASYKTSNYTAVFEDVLPMKNMPFNTNTGNLTDVSGSNKSLLDANKMEQGKDYEIKEINFSYPQFKYFGKYSKSGFGPYESDGNVKYGNIAQGAFGYMNIDINLLPVGELKNGVPIDRSETFNRIQEMINRSTFKVYLKEKGNSNLVEVGRGKFTSDNNLNMTPTIEYTSNNNIEIADGNRIKLKDGNNVESYRIVMTTEMPAVFINGSVDMKIKATEDLVNKAKQAMANSKTPIVKIYDGVNVSINRGEIETNPESVAFDYARLENGRSGVRMSLNRSYNWVKDKALSFINYNVTVENQTNLERTSDLEEAFKSDILTEEKTGTIKVLLPPGQEYVENSVTLNGKVLNVNTVENYKKTGKTLLEITFEREPSYRYNSRTRERSNLLETRGYLDRNSVSFKVVYPDIYRKTYGGNPKVEVLYESNNEQMGTAPSKTGMNKTLYGNKYRRSKPSKLMLGLPDKDGNRYLYEAINSGINEPSYALSGGSKLVDVNYEKVFTSGKGENKKVFAGGPYEYQIALGNANETYSEDIMFYDKLDSFIPENVNPKDIPFKGGLIGVDTTTLETLGINPVVYYSTKKDIQIANGIFINKEDSNLQNNDVWTTKKPSDPYSITAVAVDMSKKQDGSNFVLKEGASLVFKLKMTSPELPKGDNGENKVARNSSLFNLRQNGSSEKLVLRTLNTEIGIKPFEVEVSTNFNDDNNRDGLRNDTTTSIMELYANGKPTGKEVTLTKENGYKDKVRVKYLDEKGKPITYTVVQKKLTTDGKEIPEKSTIEGQVRDNYKFRTLDISKNNDLVSIKTENSHDPYKVDIKVTKSWTKENTPTTRPKSISVSLNRKLSDGTSSIVSTKTYYPETNKELENNKTWEIVFNNVYYNENGKKIDYFAKELDDYIEGYKIPVEKDLTITNEYYPYGDVTINNNRINTTPEAKKKDVEYILNIYRIAGGVEESVYDKFKYTTNGGKSGKVGSGDTITVNPKDGGVENITIKDIPSTYKVVITQKDKPGFTVKKNNLSNIIKSGRNVDINFQTIYNSKGHAYIKGKKELDSKKPRNYNFIFELFTKGNNEPIGSVRNGTDKAFTFNQLDYNLLDDINLNTGTNDLNNSKYQYTIKEKDLGKSGYTYDNREYNVLIKLQDNGDGTITATLEYSVDGKIVNNVEFMNKYKAYSDLKIAVFKELTNGIKPKKDQFKFDLYKYKFNNKSEMNNFKLTDKNSLITSNKILETIKNDANGKVEFYEKNHFALEKGRDDTKEFYKFFVVENLNDKDPDVIYDETVHEFTITNADKDNGKLEQEMKYTGKYVYNKETRKYTFGSNKVPVITNKYKDGDLVVAKKVNWNGETPNPNEKFKFKGRLVGPGIPYEFEINTKYDAVKDGSRSANESVESLNNESLISKAGNKLSSLFSNKIFRSASMNNSDRSANNPVFVETIEEANGDDNKYVQTQQMKDNDTYYKVQYNNTELHITNQDLYTIKINYNSNLPNVPEVSLYTGQLVEGHSEKFADQKVEGIKDWKNDKKIIKGWAKSQVDANNNKIDFKAGETIPLYDEIKTQLNNSGKTALNLYAVWADPGYTIEYDSNGGYGSETTSTAEYDKEFKIPEDKGNNLYRLGYKLVGFSEEKITDYNGDTSKLVKSLNKSESDIKNEKLTLYAVWQNLGSKIKIKNGEFEFELRDGEEITLKGLPSGTKFVITEVNEEGYGIESMSNETGVIETNKTITSKFVNKKGVTNVLSDFNNSIKINKVLDDEYINLPEFKFELTGGAEPGTDYGYTKTLTSNSNGKILFPDILYTKPGIYKYYLSEIKEDETKYIYDDSVYMIKVNIEKSGLKLNKTVEVFKGKEDSIAENRMTSNVVVFDNKTQTYPISIKRIAENLPENYGGHPMQEYRITIFDEYDNIKDTKTVSMEKGLEQKEFTDELSYPVGTKYKIEPITSVKGFTLKDINYPGGGKIGTINPDNNETKITVVYNSIGKINLDGYVDIQNSKGEISDRKPKDGEFSFEVNDKTVINSATNEMSPQENNIRFISEEVSSTDSKVFNIKQTIGTDATLEYDKSEYEVTTSLSDDLAGGISVGKLKIVKIKDRLGNAVNQEVNKVVFSNILKDSKVMIIKNIDNYPTKELVEGTEFEFELKQTFNGAQVGEVKTIKLGSADRDTNITDKIVLKNTLSDISIPYGYEYEIKEVNIPKGFVLENSKSIKGIAKDNKDIVAEFTNKYSSSASLSLNGNVKTIDESKPESERELSGYTYKFTLLKLEKDTGLSKPIESVNSSEDGRFSFSSINYTSKDVGKTFVYEVLGEENGNYEQIEYDKSVYKLEVKVKDDGSGIYLEKTLTKDDTNISNVDSEFDFVNKYKNIILEAPLTGYRRSLVTIFGGFIGLVCVGYIYNRKGTKIRRKEY